MDFLGVVSWQGPVQSLSHLSAPGQGLQLVQGWLTGAGGQPVNIARLISVANRAIVRELSIVIFPFLGFGWKGDLNSLFE